MSKFSESFTSFVTGAAIGVVAGILLAPKKGTETQKEWAERGRDVVGDWEKQLESGRKKMEEFAESLRDYQANLHNGSKETASSEKGNA